MVNSAIGYARSGWLGLGVLAGHSDGSAAALHPRLLCAVVYALVVYEGKAIVLDHLIADRSGAVPILPVSEESLAGALPRLDEIERRWVETTHYLGVSGKFALL